MRSGGWVHFSRKCLDFDSDFLQSETPQNPMQDDIYFFILICWSNVSVHGGMHLFIRYTLLQCETAVSATCIYMAVRRINLLSFLVVSGLYYDMIFLFWIICDNITTWNSLKVVVNVIFILKHSFLRYGY